MFDERLDKDRENYGEFNLLPQFRPFFPTGGRTAGAAVFGDEYLSAASDFHFFAYICSKYSKNSSIMYRLKGIALIAACCLAWTAKAARTDSITVTGRVAGISGELPRTIIINECDCSDKSERRVAELDAAGRFGARIPLSFGHTFTVNYDRDLFVSAFAEPGDSIHFEIDVSKNPAEFHLSGDKAQCNEQYAHAAYELMKTLHDVRLPANTTPLPEYMAAFKSEADRTRPVFEKYISDRDLLPEVAVMLLKDHIYTIANQAIAYRGRGKEDMFAFFTDPIFDLFDEDNAKVMIFPYHIAALCRRFPEYAAKAPKGIVRDLMMLAAKRAVMPKREDFFNQDYFDRVFDKQSEALDLSGLKAGNLIAFDGASTSGLPCVNPIDWIRKRFAGRPVYIDVSATWCGPCRASLAASEGVRTHFKDSEVAFVVLWLKSDIDLWSKLVPTIHNALHLFVSDEDTANRLMGALKVGGFPSYYFMDRSGTIITEGVPSFHSAELPDFLARSLK